MYAVLQSVWTARVQREYTCTCASLLEFGILKVFVVTKTFLSENTFLRRFTAGHERVSHDTPLQWGVIHNDVEHLPRIKSTKLTWGSPYNAMSFPMSCTSPVSWNQRLSGNFSRIRSAVWNRCTTLGTSTWRTRGRDDCDNSRRLQIRISVVYIWIAFIYEVVQVLHRLEDRPLAVVELRPFR